MDRAPTLLALALALPLLAGCTTPGEAARAPDVAASFYPLGYLAERVAGGDLGVATLVPSGTEPHEWEPTPREVERTLKARVFVYNGAGFEPWAEALVQDLRASGRVVVEATQGLALREGGPEEDEDHAGGPARDPHAWLDPVLAKAMAANIAGAIVRADAANSTAHGERAAALRADLDALDARYRGGLEDCANRNILTTHAAFGYLAARYGFAQHSISGLSPEAEPSPAKIQEAVELARRLNITHIFFETLVSPRVAETIAREAGAQTLVLNPIEGLTPEERGEGKDYLDLAAQNLANLRLAMGCR